MQNPLASFPLIELEESPSTQDALREAVAQGARVGGILARHQTAGKGRFGRQWLSGPDDSLTLSLAFHAYADHPRPWLVGMAVAVAAAGALGARVQWPNDVVVQGRKLGGILTELVEDPEGRRVPLVGVGINLNQADFPDEIAHRAVSLAQVAPGPYNPKDVLQTLLGRLEALPEPHRWESLAAAWNDLDQTSGKVYRLPDGREALALSVGTDGQLIATVAGVPIAVMAAEATFGSLQGEKKRPGA